MTLSLPLVLWILAAPAALGVLALRALGVRFGADRIGFLAWSWLAGCLVHAATLFACVVLHVAPSLWAAAPFVAGAGLLWLGRRGPAGALPAPAAADPRGQRAFLAVVALGVLWIVLQIVAGASRPCVEGDEANLWALKAKSLLVDWYGGDFVAAQHWNVHPDYPLLNPLLQAWVHAQAGAIVHFENRLPIQLCALALWLAAASAVRARSSGWLAAGLLLLLPGSPSFGWLCRAAYADGLVALGLVVALDGWLRWRDGGARSWAWVAALGAAFAMWAKNEALLYLAATLGAGMVAWLLHRPRAGWPSRATLVCLLPPLLVVVAQAAWNRSLGFQNDLLGANPTGRSMAALFVAQVGERAPVVAAHAFELAGSVTREFGVFLVLLLAPLCWPRVVLGRLLLVPTLALIGAFAGLHAVYIGSWLDVAFHMRTSHERVLFQLVPITVVWVAVVAREALRAAGALAAGRPALRR